MAEIVAEANQRLHFDPVETLPQEIISQIFEHFDPLTLYKALRVSRAWHNKASDVRLWRRLFSQEGWTVDQQAVRSLTSTADNLPLARPPSKRSRRPVSMDAGVEDHSTKRLRDSENALTGTMHPHLEPMPTEANLDSSSEGLRDSDSTSAQASSPHHPERGYAEDVDMPDRDPPDAPGQPQRNPFLSIDELGQAKPNWHYIYQQRRRLEANWMNGRFRNFRLPHSGAQSQAHRECVYTLQYSNRYVVSGSRDRSVRVWDLETQELKMPPLEGLQGHRGSVLCLQFDDRPDQDVIISGGSDSDVIVWQFSTGHVMKRLRNAHQESVLNLRFDERYLVTCSKDKTIKVWNRKALRPTDPEYPDKSGGRDAKYPKHIVNIPDLDGDLLTAQPQFEPLVPYMELLTFDGHGAAVNAIQIYRDEIVSASGDRKIMLWNIKKGTLTRTFTGHNKGIACVQYDGRRIVSGSSDNSVRIFDSSTAAEVAYLDGHRNLVRTVQAEFGDLPGDAELQEAEARENDRRLVMNQRNSRRVDRSVPYLQRYFVYGAKLPPGGGGNKWSKIVSGSYDETVIIWRRDREGRWYIAKELRQEDAMRASANLSRSGGASLSRPITPAASPPVRETPMSPADPPDLPDPPVQAAAPSTTLHVSASVNAAGGIDVASHAQPAAPHPGRRAQNMASSRSSQGQAPLTPSDQAAPAPQVTTQHMHGQAALPAPTAAPSMAQNALQNTNAHHHHHHHAHHHHHHPNLPSLPVAPANPLAHGAGGPHHHHHHHAHLTPAQQAAMLAGLNSRVFKLQFDARRIICCSQEPVIVGWDFANGDEAIIQASKYFGEPS